MVENSRKGSETPMVYIISDERNRAVIRICGWEDANVREKRIGYQV